MTRRRRWALRLAAAAVGLLPLAALEVGLRLAGVGRPQDYPDPFVGFAEVRPLFVLSDDGGRYEIPESRLTHFRPESFPAAKPAGSFRAFALGGSTVQGRPFQTETSFTTFLELTLSAADPAREWDVINCGGVSYASYRLTPILKEVLNYEPDLIIVCTGQNEFLEGREYAHVADVPIFLSWPQRQAARLHTFNWLRGVMAGPGRGRPELAAESDAILDWKGGMAEYERDPEWRRSVVAHYAFNLRRMAQTCDAAGVPLLFVTPVSNLEWPPFKSQRRDGLSDDEGREFGRLLAAGDLASLRRACEIDSRYALAHYLRGEYHKQNGDFAAAKAALVLAKDEDICPLRMTERMERVLRRVADVTDTPAVDTRSLIAGRSASGFPDGEWMVDHCHPGVKGHKLIAAAVFDRLVELDYVTPRADWRERRDEAYGRHRDGLNPAYFARGRLRLREVQAWARGQTQRERP